MGKYKNKRRTLYPKDQENFKSSKPRVQFTGSCYNKKRVANIFSNITGKRTSGKGALKTLKNKTFFQT